MAHLVKKGGLGALKNAPFLDFKVICKDKEWMVHKTYLCGDSEALVLHCTRMMEVEQGQVRFDEDEPEVIERFLVFQYVQDYDDVVALPSANQSTVQYRYGPHTNLFSNWLGAWSGNRGDGDFALNDTRAAWKCESQPTIVEGMEHLTKAQITRVLLLNVRMYALADRFNLSVLKQVAIRKLMSKERYFRYCYLDQFLGSLKAMTAPDDVDLLYRIFSRCIDNYQIVEASPGVVEVLEAISPFGWRAGVAKAKSLDLSSQRERGLSAQIDEKDERIGELEAQLEEEQSNHQSTRERLAKKNQKVNALHRLNASRKPRQNGGAQASRQ